MNLPEARQIALDHMNAHGLVEAGWAFRFDHARRRFGSCRYHDRTITLSRHLVAANTEEHVRDTILHEIAHALVGQPGHGKAWRAMAIRVGARPDRCYGSEIVEPPAAWVLSCPSCGKQWQRHRIRRTRYGCSACRDRFGRPVILVVRSNRMAA